MILSYLQKLPPGYRELAIANCRELDEYCPNMTSAIGSFDWDETREGFSFWEDIYDYYAGYRANLPPLPSGIKKEKNTSGFGTYCQRFNLWSRA